mgnify:CR=1 FL=1
MPTMSTVAILRVLPTLGIDPVKAILYTTGTPCTTQSDTW